ncbi:MAG: ATP-grasp domain-containing protein [Proteobacteria bacterium]|nr:ATP-grasp domain-containing protein [Pseudomonadota bacterium]
MKSTVAVTGLGSSDVTAPGIGVLRSLRAGPDPVAGRLIGLAYEPLEAGAFEPDLADEVYLLPFPSQGLGAFVGRLADIHRRSPLDVLIPNLDAEIPVIVKGIEELRRLGIRVFIPDARSLTLRSKDRLTTFAREHGIPTPETRLVPDEASLSEAVRDMDFPLLVKGVFYDAHLVGTVDEARGSLRHLTARWGYPAIVQEYLSGQEFDVCALGDGRGGLVGAVPITKLYLTDKGKAWAGVTVSEKELLRLTAEVVRHLSWRGPLEVEVLRAREDGRYYLIEINPRFPAWVYLCQAAGQNLPQALVKLALGREVTPMTDYEVGVRFIRSARDLIVKTDEFEAIHTRGEIIRREGVHG